VYLLSTGLPKHDAKKRRTRAEQRLVEIRAQLATATPATSAAPHSAPPSAPMLRSNFTREDYENAVARVIDYIHAGRSFQANLSQRFETELAEGDSAWALYLRLRAASPAPFSSFFNFGEGITVSSSPERFLSCRDGEVETKPIKGTKPRGRNADEDAKLAADLLASEKDRAENVMIVDLLRNDISRVCEDHSVSVTKLCELESFANVHHLVSTVRGKLRAGMTAS